MKILIVMSQPFDPNSGGVQMTTFKMGSYFFKNGMEVLYYSLAKNGHTTEYPGTMQHAEYSGAEKNSKNIETLSELILRKKPEIIINQVPYAGQVRSLLYELQLKEGFSLLACLRNTPLRYIDNVKEIVSRQYPAVLRSLFTSIPMLWFFKTRHIISHRRIIKDILDKNDCYVLLGPQNKEELAYFVGDYKAEKLRVIPNSIPRINDNLGKKERLLLYVGGISKSHKRSDLLLEVWKIVSKKLPEWNFEIVGEGSYLETLKKKVAEETIERVVVTGRQVPDDYYTRASIFIMTSEKEGFPNVLVEAQSFGAVPVVFNAYGVLSWIVNHGEDAFLIPAFDIQQMADAIVELAQDQVRLERMQKNAIHNATRFTIDRVGKMWLELFKELKHEKSVKEPSH